jgi:phospholipid-binding lipoprotein MlaA
MQFKKTGCALALVVMSLTSGCASIENKDPLEGFNRAIYKFNDTADKAVIKPVAGAYKAVVPGTVRTGVGNFFANLNSVISVVNNLLQFKFNNAFEEAGRFVMNSTFGVAGLMDVASMDGVPKHKEDLGQTLAYWGWDNSSYLVLPFIGPSSVRDGLGFAVDFWAFYPVSYIDDARTRNALYATNFLDTRAQWLPGSDLLDEAALDPYAFMRDAYTQRRASQVRDGETAVENEEYEAPAGDTSAAPAVETDASIESDAVIESATAPEAEASAS